MGFLGLGTPKWRNKNPAVRSAAVQALQPHDEHIALKVALGDDDAGIRAAAASKVRNEGPLRQLLASSDAKVVAIARERLAGAVLRIAKEQPLDRCRDVLAQIDEQSSLAELVREARDAAVRAAAFERLLALAEPSQALLAAIAVQDAEGAFAARAVPRLDERRLLKDVARKAKRDDIKAAARARVEALEAEAAKPSPESRRKARNARLEPLAPRVARALVTTDWRAAGRELDAIGQELAAIAGEFADVPADEPVAALTARIATARAAAADRQAAALAAADAEAAALAARERLLIDEAERTEAGDEARAALVARWSALPAAPVALREALERRFADLLARRFPAPGQPAPRPALDPAQAEELAALGAEAEALVAKATTAERRDAEFRFQHLHKRWLFLAGGLAPQAPERLRFLDAWNAFKDAKRAAREERDAAHGERLEEARTLCAEAVRLADAPPAEAEQRARSEQLKQLQAAFRAATAGLPDRIAGDVRGRFRAAIDRAWLPLQALREAEDWERFQNVAKAEALTAEVAALAEQGDLGRIAKSVRDAHKRWKDEVGPLPRDRQQALWDAFKATCDAQYDRCKGWFAEQDAKRAAAAETKKKLVEEAERLAAAGTVGLAGSQADRANKEATALRMKAMQAEWKAAGSAPRDQDEQLWTAFRGACDRFFASYNQVRDGERQQNLRKKLELIEAVEAIAARAEALPGAVRGDRERWLRQVKDHQAEWKAVGHVPREQQDDVWRRFRAACDRVYALDRAPAESPEEQAANLQAKQELIAKLEALVASGHAEARQEAQQLQYRWREIGGVPAGEGEALDARWRDLRDRLHQPAG